MVGDRRVSGFRDFSCREFLVIENPELPNPDPSGSSDTRPRHERLRSHREIADRDFLLHNFLTIENSDEQNSEGTRSFATCPRRWTVPD
jgi:hypothetical protein